MSKNIDEIVSKIKQPDAALTRYKVVYDDYIKGPQAENTINQLFSISVQRRDCNLLSASNIFYEYLFVERQRRQVEFCKKYIAQFWCRNHEDAVGFLQGRGLPEDIDYLENIAIGSLPTWDERDDEMQNFFRKCAWAIGEIQRRDLKGKRGKEALLRMARVEPEIAAYWAKKQLKRIVGDESPYANEDLSEPPEVDYDWPHT